MERIATSLLLSTVVTLLFTSWQFVEAIEKRSTTYYVYAIPTTPFDGNESTTVPCPARECYTLQEICETYNFTSNTTLVLLPGLHKITRNTTLEISNLQNFAISGMRKKSDSKNPVIHCSEFQSFKANMEKITGLLLTDFEVNNCNEYELFVVDSAAYIIIDTMFVYYCNKAQILLLHYKVFNGKVLVQNSVFAYNTKFWLETHSKYDNPYNTVETSSNLSIYIVIANSFFDFSKGYGRVQIFLAVPNHRYEVYVFNVKIITFPVNDIANKYALGLFFRSILERTSIITIQEFNLLTLQNNNISKLDDFVNSLYLHSGLDLSYQGGKVNVNITNSTFTGLESCVNVQSILTSDRQMRVHLNNMNFTDVHCKYGPLSIERVNHVEIYDMIIRNSSQALQISRSNVTLYGICLFAQNDQGTLLLNSHSTLFINTSSVIKFENNVCSTSNTYCPIFEADSSNIVLFEYTSVLFKNNSATGILVLHQSNLVILGNTSIVFDNNSGKNGGALSLYARSQVEICTGNYYNYYYNDCPLDDFESCEEEYYTSPKLVSRCASQRVHIMFVNNHASGKGGGIFIDDISYFSPLFGLRHLNAFEADYLQGERLQIDFINNTANITGSALYGGWIAYNWKDFAYALSLNGEQENVSMISSNPVRVCTCVSSVPYCERTVYQVDTYPGRTIQLDVVAVGQRYGTVPSIVHAELPPSNQMTLPTILNEGQYIQEVYSYCTTLQYTIFSTKEYENMVLTVNKENTPDLDVLLDTTRFDYHFTKGSDKLLYNEIIKLKEELSVFITLKHCPLGFTFNYTLKKCSCHPILNEYQTFQCDIETLRVIKPSQKWINATFIHNLENDTGVIVNDHCPFDYCRRSISNIPLDLEYPDDQCDFNRSGILCGGCQNNFSHVLGTSKCKKCSSLWTILLVPVVAIVGVLLIVAMLGLNLTVSTGMLNGLILFANILRANHSTFFNSNTFLSYFIAWLNLDLGIEMCFYDGLDAYVKPWLQFIFPLYIWTIMIILIALSRRYVFVVRLCGSNVVQVLATLFLLSYAKLIRTIITIFQFTTLVYPDGYKRRVWLYDGNVDYLRGKHIPLFIAGLILLLFLSIPYTVSLLFIQWLRKYNHHRLLRWVGKLKPLFDAYTGPFKEKHCYWFGVLLLVRVALYLVFSLNISGDTSLNLMAIGTTTACIFSYLVVVGGVYESSVANITDVSFMLNLIILTMGAHFYNNPQSMSTISVSIAFCQFILITLYHLYLRITETRKGRQWNETLQTKLKQLFTSQRVVSVREYFAPPVQARRDITHHSIELKEPLLVDVTDSHK